MAVLFVVVCCQLSMKVLFGVVYTFFGHYMTVFWSKYSGTNLQEKVYKMAVEGHNLPLTWDYIFSKSGPGYSSPSKMVAPVIPERRQDKNSIIYLYKSVTGEEGAGQGNPRLHLYTIYCAVTLCRRSTQRKRKLLGWSVHVRCNETTETSCRDVCTYRQERRPQQEGRWRPSNGNYSHLQTGKTSPSGFARTQGFFVCFLRLFWQKV